MLLFDSLQMKILLKDEINTATDWYNKITTLCIVFDVQP